MSRSVREQALEVAIRISSQRKDRTFTPDEIVRELPHLNPRTVRTHVVSRCCINAPKNHPHKWDYFRRVEYGRYQVEPKYRSQPTARVARTAAVQSPRGGRRETIHAIVTRDGSVYVAECLELAVVTQGRTLDEVVANLNEALALHMEGEDMAVLGLADQPRLQLTYDIPVAS